jgi:outer membrane protein assembly factor BamB
MSVPVMLIAAAEKLTKRPLLTRLRFRRAGKTGLFLLAAAIVWAADWPMPYGNPEHNGWAGSERQLSKANVNSLTLLYKYETDNQSRGLASLTSPIINGNLITYRGFKEMLIFAGSSDRVFSVDADLNKLLWEAHLPHAASKPPTGPPTAACPGGLTAPVIMAGSSSASLHFAGIAARTPAGKSIKAANPSPYFPPLAQSIYPLLPTTLTQLDALYTVSSDGYLHVLNNSTGQDLIPSVRFVPPNAKVTSLNLRDNVVYATTADNCDGYRNAVFALDLLSPQKRVNSFAVSLGGFAGTGGTAIGNDGTIYVQAVYAPEDRGGRPYDSVVALTPRDLKVKDYFTLSDKPVKKWKGEAPGITPVVFSFPGRDVIIAGGRDGRLYLLDSRSLGGANHQTPLFASAALAQNSKRYDGNGFRGVFSTWMDVDTGIRRFYVPVFGPPRPSTGLKTDARAAGTGFILALELRGTTVKPTLAPLWISRDILSPAPAVIANGMVFVLSRGEFPRIAKTNGKPYSIAEREQLAKPAGLYVLDALTGKELYSSKTIAASAFHPAGLALANGRAYFTARDNAVYCFGIRGQQSQLLEQ